MLTKGLQSIFELHGHTPTSNIYWSQSHSCIQISALALQELLGSSSVQWLLNDKSIFRYEARGGW